MNNEPVAWMNPKTLECGYGGDVDWEDTGCIPLYTHPAKSQADIEYELDKEYWRTKKVTDKEMIVFLMDEIDMALRWLEDGQTHMAIGVLGQCHAEIRKHLSK